MEGHDDPAWLFLVIFLIFWGWWKDIKVIAAMLAVRASVEQIEDLYKGMEDLIEKIRVKNTKK